MKSKVALLSAISSMTCFFLFKSNYNDDGYYYLPALPISPWSLRSQFRVPNSKVPRLPTRGG